MKRDNEKTLLNENRWLLGAGLGALIGIIIGWAAAGGWNSLYLRGIPTDLHSQAIRKTTLIGAGMGGIWGLVSVWPRKIMETAGLTILSLTVGFILILGLFLGFFHLPSLIDTFRFIVPWALVPAFVLIRLSLTILERGVVRSQTFKIVNIGLCLLIVASCTLVATWSIDQLAEALLQRRMMLIEVHEYSLAKGWEVDRLDIKGNLFLIDTRDPPGVRVHLSNGDEFICTYPSGEGPVCPSQE
jgi:hypothetical protein